MLALSTVLRRPIFSVYPEANPGLRPIFHWKILPRMAEEPIFAQIQIMWSRDGNLDLCPNAVFQPNHFVPVLALKNLADVTAKKFKNENIQPAKKKPWPHDIDSLLDLGSDEVACLVTWSRPVLENGGCRVEAVPREWVSLKVMVRTQFQDMAYSRLWTTMLTKEPYKFDHENVLHLVELLLVLPISSAQCQRAFSTRNRIKSAKRSCLETETTEDLIRISLEGPHVTEFVPSQAVELWFSTAQRPRRPFFKDH